MTKTWQKVATFLIVIGIAYCALGMIGYLPSQYDLLKQQPTLATYGVINEYPTTHGQELREITFDSSTGNVWFLTSGLPAPSTKKHYVMECTQTGVMTSYNILDNSIPYDIVINGDNVWFTEYAMYGIGHISKSTGTYTRYSIPTFNCNPNGIEVDTSGNVWFCEQGAGKIGKMTPAGSFTEYPMSNPLSQPVDCVFDHTGTLWFTERYGNKIWSFNPSTTTFTGYTIPTGNSDPCGIVYDGTEYLWFTESLTNKIGKFSIISKTFTEYAITGSNTPKYITLDSDDVIWTDMQSNSIKKIETDGTGLVSYTVPTVGSFPYGICYDTINKHIWFTEFYGDNVGKLNYVSGLVVPPPPEILINITNVGEWNVTFGGDMYAYVGDPIIVKAEIETLHSAYVTETKIYYNDVGETNLTKSINMNLVSGNFTDGVWSGILPAQNDIGNMYFKIHTIDEYSNINSTSPMKITIMEEPTIPPSPEEPTINWWYGLGIAGFTALGLVVNRDTKWQRM